MEVIPFPMIVADQNGEITWYNRMCKDDVFLGEDQFGMPVSDIVAGADPADPSKSQGRGIRYKNKLYTVHVTSILSEDGTPLSIYFLVDDTTLKKYMFEYKESRPSVGIVVIDNYQEIMQDAKESEKAQTIGQLETIIDNYMAEGSCLLRRLDRDRFLIVAEETKISGFSASAFEPTGSPVRIYSSTIAASIFIALVSNLTTFLRTLALCSSEC